MVTVNKVVILFIIVGSSFVYILLAGQSKASDYKLHIVPIMNLKRNVLPDPSSPVLTARPLGRLGNQMGEYGTIFCYHKMYNTTVVLHPDMSEKLTGHFKNLTVKETEGLQSIKWKGMRLRGTIYNYSMIDDAATGKLGNQYFATSGYPFELDLFQKFKPELLKEFEFDDRYIQKADMFLRSAKDKFFPFEDPSMITYIGFHIRREDYARHMKNFGGTLPDLPYFKNAINFYENRFSHAIYILATNGISFAEETLKNEERIYFSKDNDPFEDMALLARCNHSIITLGTYGFWGGFLANGTVVYPDITTEKEYRFCKEKYEQAKMTNFIPLPVD